MVKHNPNPNEHTSPSRYRHTGHRIVEQPTSHHPSRYRHDNTNKVPHNMNPIEIIKTNSRRGRTNQGTNEKRNEGKKRAAASGAEKTATRQHKDAEATEDRSWREKRTNHTDTGYEVADLTSASELTRKTKEKSAGTHPRKSAKRPGAGYEVADLTQEAQIIREKEEKSAEAQSKTLAKQLEAGYEVADVAHATEPTREAQGKSAGAHPRKSTKPTGSGYEVANLTQETRNTRETRGRSTEAHINTVTKKRPGPSKYRQTGGPPHTSHTRLEHSMYQQCDTAHQRDTARNDPSRYRQTSSSRNRTPWDIRRSGTPHHNSHPTRHRPTWDRQRSEKPQRNSHPSRYRQVHARLDPSTYRQYITEKRIDSENNGPHRYQRPYALICRYSGDTITPPNIDRNQTSLHPLICHSCGRYKAWTT